jgi:hypothetical protein
LHEETQWVKTQTWVSKTDSSGESGPHPHPSHTPGLPSQPHLPSEQSGAHTLDTRLCPRSWYSEDLSGAQTPAFKTSQTFGEQPKLMTHWR